MSKERKSSTQNRKSCKNCKYGHNVPVVVGSDSTTRLVCTHPNATLETLGIPPLTIACRVDDTLCGMSMRWFEMK